MACGILQDQGSNLHLLHWQVDSLPLSHQGSLKVVLLKTCIQEEESFCNLPEEQQRKNGVWNSRCSRYPTESHVCFVSRSCPTLCDLMNCSPPGSSVHEILQARILELGAMGSSQPKDPTSVSCISCIAGRFFIAEPPGKSLYSDIRIMSISGAKLLIQLKFTISTLKWSLT